MCLRAIISDQNVAEFDALQYINEKLFLEAKIIAKTQATQNSDKLHSRLEYLNRL
jgi:hypothetical protein